ncbi:GyrI-like domain-containing protein [Paenibacillus sp. HW567]|uniref:GyrI-like domain-containing protein n=1 Tax=Paenibacillus sp. HW567 TaxID=1034769 RepID=UPI00037B1C43|nr:GyrI-like domain-containing protein [Paenibacillus sp. HW567]
MSIYTVEKPEIRLVGVSVRTTNQVELGPNGLLPGLWDTYFGSSLASRAGMGSSEPLYSLYTDYESDASGAYTVVIGHEVSEEAAFQPDDKLSYAVIPASKYLVFTAEKGPVNEVVPEAWREIWAYFEKSPELRTYTGDYELYPSRNLDPGANEVQIYIAVK